MVAYQIVILQVDDSDKLNELFEHEISKLEYNPIIKELMKEILLDNYKQFIYDIESKRKSISKEISLPHEKVSNREINIFPINWMKMIIKK